MILWKARVLNVIQGARVTIVQVPPTPVPICDKFTLVQLDVGIVNA
jgi:hypothetical protein